MWNDFSSFISLIVSWMFYEHPYSVCHGMWWIFLIILSRMRKEFHITGVNSKSICGVRKESSRPKINECIQKPNIEKVPLSTLWGEQHVSFCRLGWGYLMWGTTSVLISTRTWIVLLLHCVWSYRTNLVCLIRFWRIQKGPTPDLNCFPWWHYWVLF